MHDKGVFAVLSTFFLVTIIIWYLLPVYEVVNGTAGEGVSLTVDERKKITEIWKSACTKYGMTLMVQIGGTTFNNIAELV